MKRVDLQPAYVLHRRPYRETSFLIDLFTPEHGRLTALAKGVRKARSASQGLLQPFLPLTVSWTGKGELMTLTQVEMAPPLSPQSLRGDCLFAGFYLNELLMGLLQKWEAQPTLFAVYAQTIAALQTNTLNEKVLRKFEKFLLEVLGYGLLTISDKTLTDTYQPDCYYRFMPEQGFVLSGGGEHAKGLATIFSGKSLLAIAREEWDDQEILQDAKRLMRILLAPLLGTRAIHSRQLFLKREKVSNEA